LEFTHLQRRDEHWAIVDLVGKGGHIRTVPVPDWVKAAVDLWVVAAGISAGRLFRCVCRAGKCWGVGVTERVVWHVVKDYARKVGLSQVARNYVTQQAENWNRSNSSSVTFRFRPLSATLVVNSGSAERSTTV
jgi:site-specific recombinase XerD